MLFREKTRNPTPPILLTSNGGSDGLIQVPSIDGLYTKQKINLASNTQEGVLLEIKAFVDEKSFYVGLAGSIEDRYDCSAFLTADGAYVQADRQTRSGPDGAAITRAIYQEEPAVALRTINVDKFGNATSGGKLVNVEYDAGSVTYPSGTQEVYAFFKGGLSGVRVATLTVNYTSISKENILNFSVTYP